MSIGVVIAIAAGALVLGAVVSWLLVTMNMKNKLGSIQSEAERIIAKAEKESAQILKQATVDTNEMEKNMRRELDREMSVRRRDVQKSEENLLTREQNLEKKSGYLDQREQDFAGREKKIKNVEEKVKERLNEADEKFNEQVHELERISGLTRDEALVQLEEKLHDEAKMRAAKRIKETVTELKERAQEEGQKIIATSIQRYAGEYVAERTVSVVPLPNDDMKGRIIGREGRNIRAIEAATGMDVIIDDTPEAIVISGMNPVRREVARLSLMKLIEDGRIHPGRIEEVVIASQKLVDKKIKEYGDRAIFDLGIHGIHPELVKLLGQLRYRYSYSQNVWAHSIEVGFLAGMMAAELKLPVKKAKRAGLLHDIGKAVTHELDGSHAVNGAEIARKYNEAKDIVHAIEAHHEDVPVQSALAVVVQAADALSGARPGARRELMEQYVKRITELEGIAKSFKGVEKSYAIQAGRELRVIVEAAKVTDDVAVAMSDDIAARIENEMTYPGQIKVTVIRETRAAAIAK